MNRVVFSCSLAAIALVVFLLTKPFDRRILAGFALLAAIYLGVDDFITGLPSLVKGVDFLGGQWNWTGKVLSLGFSAVVILALRVSPATVGLTFEQRNLKVALLALAFFIVWGACLG